MPTIIDGYNLLHATPIFGRRRAHGSLETSRLALLDFLASSMEVEEVQQTAVVFDASDAPSGLPREEKYRGLTVHYASAYQDADTMIEELIRAHDAPRTLTIVSSDHQVQRAARRRKATAVDSDIWFNQLNNRPREKQPDRKPTTSQSEQDVQNWLEEFRDAESIASEIEQQSKPIDLPEKQIDPVQETEADAWNPFPPGYGEDLLDDEDFHDM